MDNIKLTPRLQCVANFLEHCNLLADIGTDHAYIPIYAIQNKKALKAIASDVVKGPLKIASKNIKAHGLEGKIITVLANGLASAQDADIIVIAGMGGKLICDILNQNLEIAQSADFLIIQAMTCSFELRRFLHDNNFEIIDEKLTKEEDKIYNVMVVKKGCEKYQDDIYYHIGKKLFENNDPLLLEHIKSCATVLGKQINGMNKSSNPNLHKKAEELKKLYSRFIEEAEKL